jgi:hypothetical protein
MLSVALKKKAAHLVGAVVVASLAMGLTSSVVSAADQDAMSADFMEHGNHSHHDDLSPLVRKVHDATVRYSKDINFALKYEHGWDLRTPCVSGPDHGAMGVHILQSSRISDGILDPKNPEALIYEPLPNGSFRLVGVEFIQTADEWAVLHPNGPVPSVDGNLMNLVAAPNRYGLGAFYELHVWAWEDNPNGSFADWNDLVTCEKQPTSRY